MLTCHRYAAARGNPCPGSSCAPKASGTGGGGRQAAVSPEVKTCRDFPDCLVRDGRPARVLINNIASHWGDKRLPVLRHGHEEAAADPIGLPRALSAHCRRFVQVTCTCLLQMLPRDAQTLNGKLSAVP